MGKVGEGGRGGRKGMRSEWSRQTCQLHTWFRMSKLRIQKDLQLKSHVVVRRFDDNIAKLGEEYGVIC